MPDTKRPPRRHLTVGEAQAIAEDLRHGRRDRIVDVRFPEGFQLQVGAMRGVSIVNSQLWLTVGGGMFRGGLMEDCTFIDVDLDPLTVHKAEMRSNTFERVAFGLQAMAGIDDTVIEGGSFRDCRLVDFGFRKTRLTGVSIAGGRLDRVRFASCAFADTRLESTLRDVTFAGCDFAAADMTSSDVVDVIFDELRSSDLRLPSRRTGFFVTPAAATEALATVLPDLSTAFRDRVSADLILAGHDLVAVSERFLTSALGAGPTEASALVDALFPHRLESLDQVVLDRRAATR
jgi:hypothetical protein